MVFLKFFVALGEFKCLDFLMKMRVWNVGFEFRTEIRWIRSDPAK
jgi:hypothetical protein